MKYATFVILLALAVILILPISMLDVTLVVDPNTILLTSANTLVLNAEVNGESESTVLTKAKSLDAALVTNEPLYLYLQTPGGSVESGQEMIETLTGLGRPVHTITAFAASMGFHLAQNLGTRYILHTGVLMSHRASGGVQGSFGGMEPSQMQNRYSLMQRQMHEMDLQVVKRTKGKQTLESYLKAFDNELYVTGPEAIQEGYADRVIKVKCDRTLSGSSTYTTSFMGVQVEYQLDNCPINSSPHDLRVAIPTTEGYMTEEKFVKKGGFFGMGCVQVAAVSKGKPCALDASLTPESLVKVRKAFVSSFERNRTNVIPMGL